MNMHSSSLRCLTFCLIGLCTARIGLAQDTPEVVLNAAYSAQNGSNLSYVPDVLLGTANNTRHLETATLGFSVRTQQGLQRLKLDGSLVNRSFESTQTTNAVTSNYNLVWLWSLTPRFSGELGTDRREAFDTLVNSPFDGQANSVLTTGTHLDGAWEVDGPWRLLGGVSQARTATNFSNANDPSDQRTQSANVGVRYVLGSGSSLTFKLVSTDGEFVATSLAAPITFHERDTDVRLHWALGGASFADAYLTHVDNTRNAPASTIAQSSGLNFSGLNGGGSINWALSGQSVLQLDVSRTLAATGLSSPLFSESDSVSIGPVWQTSAKTAITLHHTWTQQTFRGYVQGTDPRRDTLRSTVLSFSWQPRQHWSLSAGLQRVTRDSNELYAVVASDAATLAAQFTF
jgi:exopolysaccharide biosynthesis operon protein EpsL